MAEMKRCPGCLKFFSSQRAHLAQTSSSLRRRLAEKRKSSRLGFARIPERESPQPDNSPPIPTNERLSLPEQGAAQSPSLELLNAPSSENQWVDDDEDGEGGDEDSEEDGLEVTLESSESPGWEPPVSNDTDNVSISSDNMDTTPPPSPPEDLRRRTWVTPQVVQFPNPRAGEPVRSVNSTNNVYAALLGEGSASNPYSPFASKLDWEMAKWAKLRGPSSTSLADLLKIEGVILFRSGVQLLRTDFFCHRFTKH